MKKIISIHLLVLIAACLHGQQDPQYNLYQFNQMVINPAYAGARDAISVTTAVRRQWAGFSGAPRTACMSAHMPIMNKNLGVGVTVVQDAIGPRKNTGAYGNAAYILKLGEKARLSFGIAAGYSRYQFDFSELTFKNTETSNEFLSTQTKGILDMGAGTFFRTNKFFAGLSATHITESKLFEYGTPGAPLQYRLRTHLFFTMGGSFNISENILFAPSTMLKMANTSSMDLNLNFFLFKKVWIGVFARGGYGPGALLQYHVTNKFRVGYSYDTGSGAASRLGPSHEVMLGFDFSENKSKVVSPRFL